MVHESSRCTRTSLATTSRSTPAMRSSEHSGSLIPLAPLTGFHGIAKCRFDIHLQHRHSFHRHTGRDIAPRAAIALDDVAGYSPACRSSRGRTRQLIMGRDDHRHSGNIPDCRERSHECPLRCRVLSTTHASLDAADSSLQRRYGGVGMSSLSQRPTEPFVRQSQSLPTSRPTCTSLAWHSTLTTRSAMALRRCIHG